MPTTYNNPINIFQFPCNPNGPKNNLFKDFQHKLKNIDQIAQLAMQNKQKRISEKYSNIQSTAKILKNLIVQFSKKSQRIEGDLRQTANIADIQYQTQYHKKRIQDCLKLSQNLQKLIENKKKDVQVYQNEAKKIKAQLILLKTQNIKKILKIEMLERMDQQKKGKLMKDNKFKMNKQKMNEQRALMHTGMNYKNNNTVIQALKKQKIQLTIFLWAKIDKKITISNILFKNYQHLKQKLIKKQKKSNMYGLTGTLLFKLTQNKQNQKKVGPIVSRKNKFDPKLLIYDVLKQKYLNQIKNEHQSKKQIKIEFDQFMKFTPLQILGLIELKGGIQYFRKNKKQMFSQVKTDQLLITKFSNINQMNGTIKTQTKNYITYNNMSKIQV